MVSSRRGQWRGRPHRVEPARIGKACSTRQKFIDVATNRKIVMVALRTSHRDR